MSTLASISSEPDCISFHELDQFLHALGDPRLLLHPEHMAIRLNALDELDAIAGDLDSGAAVTSSDRGLLVRARALKLQFEAANAVLYQAAHDEIATHGTSASFSRWLKEDADAPRPGLSFDLLDEIVSGVLQLHGPKGDGVLPSAEMTAYQPTPVRHILDLIGACNFSSDDVLVDLGSGLGHVPLLAGILAGIRTLGIELQSDHTASAQQAAQRLNLKRVRFLAEDARTADLTQGTVFYLFTPFRGSVLTRVLGRLRTQSESKQIRICTLGPCTCTLQGQTWLKALRRPDTERITIFESL